eukprot:16448725-Heterocapsa_arctica.AAC.1
MDQPAFGGKGKKGKGKKGTGKTCDDDGKAGRPPEHYYYPLDRESKGGGKGQKGASGNDKPTSRPTSTPRLKATTPGAAEAIPPAHPAALRSDGTGESGMSFSRTRNPPP